MDKREIAANMLLRAVKSYVQAENDFDYIQSILLAGASLGITEELLKEDRTRSTNHKSADSVIAMKEANFRMEGNKLVVEKSVRSISDSERKSIIQQSKYAERKVYNSLKHAGNKWTNTLGYEDLNIEANFKEEFEEILFAAIDDFNAVTFDENFEYHELSEEIISLLNCGDPLGCLPQFVCRDRNHD